MYSYLNLHISAFFQILNLLFVWFFFIKMIQRGRLARLSTEVFIHIVKVFDTNAE